MLLVVVFSFVTILIAFGLPFTPFAFSTADILSGLTFADPRGRARRGARHVRDHRRRRRRDHLLHLLVRREGLRPLRRAERRQRGMGAARQGLDQRHVQGRLRLLDHLHLRHARVLHHGRGRPAPAGPHPRGQRDDHHAVAHVHRHARRLGEHAVPGRRLAVLGSTLWAAIPSWARMYTNLLAEIGVVDWHDTRGPPRAGSAIFTVALPIIWAAAYLFIQSPVLMVQIGGVMTGVFLLAVVVAVWYLRRTEIDPRLYGGVCSTRCWSSAASRSSCWASTRRSACSRCSADAPPGTRWSDYGLALIAERSGLADLISLACPSRRDREGQGGPRDHRGRPRRIG